MLYLHLQEAKKQKMWDGKEDGEGLFSTSYRNYLLKHITQLSQRDFFSTS